MKKLLLLFAVGLTTAISAQSIPSYVPTDSLVGWWPFNGNANDESGNGNNGIVNGATLSLDRNGDTNKAFKFDGINDWIDFNNPQILQIDSAFTYSAWVKVLGMSNFMGVMGRGEGTGGSKRASMMMIPPNKCVRLELFDGSTVNNSFTLQNTLQDSLWYHITCTWSGNADTNGLKTYINGTLVSTAASTISTINNNINDNDNRFKVGSRDNLSGGWAYGYFNGLIDDVGVWRRELNAMEVYKLFKAGGCTAYDTIFTNVSDTVLLTVTDTLIIDVNFIGFNPVQFEHSVKAYPNPAKDHLVMDIPSAMITQGYSIDIKNSAGQSVFQSQLNQAQLQIDLTTWGNGGLYFLHLLDSNGSMVDVKKIILQ